MSRLAALIAFALQVAAAGSLASQTRPADSLTGRALVTAVTQGMVYVGAGRNDGLREGSAVRVPRLGERGLFRVVYLSSRSAACQGDSTSALPAVGDTVAFQPAAPEQAPARAGSPGRGTAATSASDRRRGPGMRGRVGIRYLSSIDHQSGVTLRQPGVELLLDGPLAPGAPVALAVDIRSRRTTMYRGGQETTSRALMGVYQAAIRVQSARGAFRAVLGRQYAPTLAGLGLFDGLLLDVQHPSWGGGLMAGMEPEVGTLAVSSEVRQLGGYLQARSRGAARVRWSLSTGALGSYVAGGEVNREFGFVQATLGGRAFSLVALQELDLNRGWKAAAGESRLSPTSTFISLQLAPAPWLSLSGGLDNRRNVRLYRDLSTPEEVFDDRFRLGLWGGLHLSLGPRVRLGTDLRTSTVGGIDSLRTTAYSGNLSLDRLTSLGLGMRLRITRYATPGRGPGWLYSGSFRFAPATVGSLELLGGSRREERWPASNRSWAGASAELFLRRAWFGLASFTREWGRDGLTPTTDQLYAGLSYRF